MTRPLLLQRLHTPLDLDYVDGFQGLARVNMEIRDRGETPQRLLQKAIMEHRVGNYVAALESAQEAAALDPDASEAQYQAALAAALLAFVRAGALPHGPGAASALKEPAEGLLKRSIRFLKEALRLNPADEEAKEDLEALRGLSAANRGAAALEAALRAHAPSPCPENT